MKANRTARQHHRPHDDGVSSVLGGILFFALITLVLVTIQADFVPRWEEDKEADHMASLRAQLSSIKSEADRQAANATTQPVGLPVTLQKDSSNRFFSSATLPAAISFQPGVGNVHLEASELLVFRQNGQSLAGASETWTDLGGSSEVADVDHIEHLRLRLIDPGNEDEGDNVIITVTDASGDFAGSLTAYIAADAPDKFINTRVTRADGETVYDQGIFFHQQTGVDYWWIDALADELHFADILAAAQAPLTLTLGENGMQGQFTATYVEATSGQTTGTSGKTYADWSHDQAGGVLSVEAQNSRFPSQTYRVEAGAIILEQGDGRVFATPPLLTASSGATTTRISLTLPLLTGPAASAGGASAATVVLDGGGSTHISGTAPNLSLTLNTTHGELWAQLLHERLDTAGLDSDAGEYSITTTANQVEMTVFGRITAPASAQHDLFLELHIAPVQVRIET